MRLKSVSLIQDSRQDLRGFNIHFNNGPFTSEKVLVFRFWSCPSPVVPCQGGGEGRLKVDKYYS